MKCPGLANIGVLAVLDLRFDDGHADVSQILGSPRVHVGLSGFVFVLGGGEDGHHQNRHQGKGTNHHHQRHSLTAGFKGMGCQRFHGMGPVGINLIGQMICFCSEHGKYLSCNDTKSCHPLAR